MFQVTYHRQNSSQYVHYCVRNSPNVRICINVSHHDHLEDRRNRLSSLKIERHISALNERFDRNNGHENITGKYVAYHLGKVGRGWKKYGKNQKNNCEKIEWYHFYINAQANFVYVHTDVTCTTRPYSIGFHSVG